VGTWPGIFGYQGQAWTEIFSANGTQRPLLSPTRLYDPVDGRFVSEDPQVLRGPRNGLTPFLFVAQNPLIFVARDGRGYGYILESLPNRPGYGMGIGIVIPGAPLGKPNVQLIIPSPSIGTMNPYSLNTLIAGSLTDSNTDPAPAALENQVGAKLGINNPSKGHIGTCGDADWAVIWQLTGVFTGRQMGYVGQYVSLDYEFTDCDGGTLPSPYKTPSGGGFTEFWPVPPPYTKPPGGDGWDVTWGKLCTKGWVLIKGVAGFYYGVLPAGAMANNPATDSGTTLSIPGTVNMGTLASNLKVRTMRVDWECCPNRQDSKLAITIDGAPATIK
jgi:hypothetical protein